MYLQNYLGEILGAYEHSVAIEENGKAISYSELLDRSNKVSAFLLANGFSQPSRIGICVDNVTDMTLCMIGAIRARCVFVPIDATLPDRRLALIIEKSKPDLIIVSNNLDGEQTTGSIRSVTLADILGMPTGERLTEYPDYQEDDDLYIYFTSGSTGEPKGIVGKNSSLWHFLHWEREAFNIKPGQRFSQLISPYFDAFLRDIFIPLTTGGTICVPPREEGLFIPEQLIQWIDEQQINFIHCVPSVFRILNNKSASAHNYQKLEYVLLSGERIIPSELINWYDTFGDRIQLVNLYGSTEATMISSYYNLGSQDAFKSKIPIGEPISDVDLIIMDKNKRPCKPLVVGEIYIVSDYLSNGYLNELALTREKFIEVDGKSGKQLAFKTGDSGRILADGSIELLGREDRLIKLRGIRIELDEIERVLRNCPLVKNGVVLHDKKTDSLVAFVVSAEKENISQDKLTARIEEYLADHLPGNMTPSRICTIDSIPLLSNGKVDYNSLLKKSEEVQEVVMPGNEIEEKVLMLWKEILQADQVSTDKNFQAAGGNSLSIMRLMSRIFAEFSVRVSLAELFANLTIQKQAILIKAKLDDITISETSEQITKAPVQPHYRLSSSQKRLYFLYQLNPAAIAYNLPQVVELEGSVDRDKVEETFRKLIDRHESLRTSIVTVDEEVFQKVSEDVSFSIEYFEPATADSRTIIEQFTRPFDLSQAPLIRVSLIKQTAGSHLLLVDMHHIITDGVSQSILIKDFMALYNNEELPELPLQYTDYSEWQQAAEQQERLSAQQDFWKQEFAGEVSVLDLPVDHQRPAVKSYAGSHLSFSLSREETSELKVLSDQSGTSLFMTILSVFNILLSKLSNQDDITIGTAIAGRYRKDLEGITGMFVNTLALRNYPTGTISFREFLSQVKERSLVCFENQQYPYEDLIEDLQVRRDTSRNPLFDVMFTFHNFQQEQLVIPGLILHPFDNDFGISKFDLSLSAAESAGALNLTFEYSTELFEAKTIERFIAYFKRIVAAVTEDGDRKISGIDILSESERYQLLYEFNDTGVDYPKDKTIVHLFEVHAANTPDNVALVFEDREWTYGDLNRRSNQLARMLRAEGCRSNTIVGLLTERGPWTIIAILATLKAGGAYLPIDIEYPVERIQFLLDDSGMGILITERSQAGIVDEDRMRCIFTDELQLDNEDSSNLDLEISPSDLCYIIYTSGTTGNPKGVMIEHRNVVRLLFNQGFQFDFGPEDVWTMFHSHTFDFSVWEMYGALLYGGKLIIIPKPIARDTRLFLGILQNHNVTVLNQTPSAFYNLSNEEYSGRPDDLALRYVIFGGEALSPSKLRGWRSRHPNVQLINMYGITETTVHVTYKEITDYEIDHNINSIGNPIPTLSVYLLDKYQRLVPVGVQGELHIGGEGLARGYLNREQLTKEKFIDNPYKSGERLYKSGDVGRLSSNGEIEYFGRLDDQVKIRGYRVELGEIESRLVSHPGIKEAVVLAKQQEGDQYLVGYYVAESEIPAIELADYLSHALPEYMLPACYVHMDSIPLTANGKTDRKRLPEPKFTTGEDYVAPADEQEEQLVEIWSELLQLDKDTISVNTSFFRLGGHSLKAMTLVNRLSKQFDVDIPLKEIFSRQDIRGLSAFITQAEKSAYSSIQKSAAKENYVLSSAQRRMFFLYELDKTSIAYNMPVVIELAGTLDKNRLRNTFQKLIDRHESLRTSFDQANGKMVQRVHEEVDFILEYHEAAASEAGSIIREFIRPFDLSHAPMIRAGLIQLSGKEHLLMVDMHHIITDAVSQTILIRDFMALYDNEKLPELRLQYKDYSEWQQGPRQKKQLSDQRKFWMQEFAEEVSILDLPADHPRPAIKKHDGSNLSFIIEQEEKDRLKILGEGAGATLFMTVLAVLNVLLSKLSSLEDITIGTPVAGRNHADLEEMMGLFVNTLALRNYPKGELSFKEFLLEVKEKTLSCFGNQSYPYEELVNALNIPRDTSRNPLFDVMFMLQNVEQEELAIPGLKLKPYNHGHGIAKFDLLLSANESAGALYLDLEYSTELFEAKTIERFVAYFKRIVTAITENGDIPLSGIDILSKAERHQLLHAFNDTTVDYPRNKTILDLFEQQVARTPDNVAVIFGDHVLTYRQLQERSHRIAGYLQQEYGVKAGDFVGLLLDREEELLPCIFGILRSGAAYVPLSTGYPRVRLNIIRADSGLTVLITRKRHIDALSVVMGSGLLDLDTALEKINERPLPVLNAGPVGGDLAYLIYTSGSTGKPKGVMIEHHSIVNRLLWMQKEYALTEKDVLLQKTPLVFDVSIWELFWWSFTGASVCLLPPEGEKDPRKIINEIEKNGVSTIHFVPSMLSAFLDRVEVTPGNPLQSLRQVFASGEALRADQVNSFGKTLHATYGTSLINLYGPTEATVDVSYYECDFSKKGEVIPIGKPIDNTRLYILDKTSGLAPLGVAGELCIGGVGLATGYLNNEGLTSEKFITASFDHEERLYRTGDLACWLPDGNIRYLGRMDDQVKIRGHRIEPGEIEVRLLSYANVKQAVVTCLETNDDKKLVAFLVSETNAVLNTLDVRQFLKNELPEYMIPTLIRKIDEIPLTNNGKIDRKGLLASIDKSVLEKLSLLKPRTEIEIRVAKIWSDLLTIDEIGVDENFFDLGGHSILLLRVNSAISDEFGIDLPLYLYFSNTLGQICKEIETKLKDLHPGKIESGVEYSE